MAQSALSLPFREQGRLADARAALEEALVHAPSGPHADRARVNLGLVLLELQAPRDAIEVLARAIDGASRRGSSSDLLFPELGLAIAWMDLGDRPLVERHLSAVALHPLPLGVEAECHLIRGLAAHDHGDGAVARRWLDAALEAPLHPTATTEAELALAWVLLADGDPGAAASVVRPAVERATAAGARLLEVQARSTAAIAVTEVGERDEARALLAPIAAFAAQPCRATLIRDVAEAGLAPARASAVRAEVRGLAPRSIVARRMAQVLDRRR